jgi:hypothetical protein
MQVNKVMKRIGTEVQEDRKKGKLMKEMGKREEAK